MRNFLKEYLPKDQLVKGGIYEVWARGFRVAIWTGDKFAGVRNDMNQYVVDEQAHWDDGPEGFGCVKPVKELDVGDAEYNGAESIDEYIPIDELVIAKAYHVAGRNFYIAIWTGSSFAGLRYKFGDCFIDQENHWDEGPNNHGTVKPLRELK